MFDELNVLYQFDDNYAPYAGISMLSLFRNNQTIRELNVYCATMNISQKNKGLIVRNATKYNRKIIFLDTTKTIKLIQDINVGEWNGSLATWMKMFIIEGLIGKIDSLLYIDCDTLILSSLEDLCNFNFEDNALAAVVDSIGFEHLHRLGIEDNKFYYNAGIIFFNLRYFYEHNDLYRKMIIYLKKNIKRYSVNDQDLLNDYFKGRIKKLSPQYNFQGIHYIYPEKVYFKVYKKYDYYSIDEISWSRKNVKIVHFLRVLGKYPWEGGLNLHPLKLEFEHWKQQSLWKNITPKKKKESIFFLIEMLLYKLLPKRNFLQLFKYMKLLSNKFS